MVTQGSDNLDRREFNKSLFLSAIFSVSDGKFGPVGALGAGSLISGGATPIPAASPENIAERRLRGVQAQLYQLKKPGSKFGSSIVDSLEAWLRKASSPNKVYCQDSLAAPSFREALAAYLDQELARIPEADCFQVNVPMRVTASYLLENQVRAEIPSSNGHPFVRQRSTIGDLGQTPQHVRRLFAALPFEAGKESKECASTSPAELVSLIRKRERLTANDNYEAEHVSQLYLAHHPNATEERQAMESSGRVPAADVHRPIPGVVELPHSIIGIVHRGDGGYTIEERFFTMTESGRPICVSHARLGLADFKRQQPTMVEALLQEASGKTVWLDQLKKA